MPIKDPVARAAWHKAWRAANKDKVAAHGKTYRENHKADLAERKKAYVEANKEATRAQQDAWRKANLEHVRARQNAYDKKYREENRDKVYARQKAWIDANREHISAVTKAWREANKERIADEVLKSDLADKDRIANFIIRSSPSEVYLQKIIDMLGMNITDLEPATSTVPKKWNPNRTGNVNPADYGSLDEVSNSFLDTEEGGYMREYIDDVVEDSMGGPEDLDLDYRSDFDIAFKLALIKLQNDHPELNFNAIKANKASFW